MKKLFMILSLILLMTLSCFAAINPVLRYSNAGTFPLWTEEAYYCSPVTEDLDGDGKNEIIFSNYTITVLNEADGSIKFKVNSGYDTTSPLEEFGKSVGNTWCDAVVCDIDGNGKKEIITIHSNGLISVLDSNGRFAKGWPQKPISSPGKCVKADDLDGDGKLEIIAGYGVYGGKSVYVFNYDGTVREGWPQLSDENSAKAYSYGIFMNGISTGDLDGDGKKEIIVPNDTSYVDVYRHDGSLYPANSEIFGNRVWGKVALYEEYGSEIRGDNGGWGFKIEGGENRENLYKAEFGHGVSVVRDIDGNGTKEVIVTGIMCNRKYAPTYPPTEYMTVSVFNADRTRYVNPSAGGDWRNIPTDLGAPLLQNTKSIASQIQQTPVVEDLDGDGKCEILFNSYNGKVHCFDLDATEPYAWPYSLTKRTSPLFEYASPVVCHDLDGDGKKEVIFASWYDENQKLDKIMQGSLYILSYEGKLISKVTLPPAKEKDNLNNGVLAMPLVEDIDGDGKFEIVLNTTNGAVCVYDL